ncbi:MAG TPA: helix-turn-helix transcriptional regulator [Pseudonocardia sp.]
MRPPHRRARRAPVPAPLEGPAAHMQIVDPDLIRRHRQARRFTLRNLAELLGNNSQGRPMCTYQAISNWESGATKTCPEETAVRLSKVLEFPLLSVFAAVEGPAMPGVSTGSHPDARALAS